MLSGWPGLWWATAVEKLRLCPLMETLNIRVPLDTEPSFDAVGHSFTTGTQLNILHTFASSLPSSLRVLSITLAFGDNRHTLKILDLITRIQFRRISHDVAQLPLLRGITIDVDLPEHMRDHWIGFCHHRIVSSFSSGPFLFVSSRLSEFLADFTMTNLSRLSIQAAATTLQVRRRF